MTLPPCAPDLRRYLRLEFSAGGHPITLVVAQRAGGLLAWLAGRAGLSPNQVTMAAFAASLAGAAVYATGADGPAAMAWALILTQLGYALDCADGQLARATQRTSTIGGWLDVYLDFGTISSLAFAAVYRATILEPESALLITVAGFAYCFARIADLHTCAVLRQTGGAVSVQRKSMVRLLFLAAIDTPLVLLLIVLLRDRPQMLAAYLAVTALLFLIHGLALGTRPAWKRAIE